MILENVNKMLQFTSWSIFDSDELEKKWMQLFFFPAISNIVIVQLHYCHIIRHPSLPLGWRQNPPGTIN